MADGGSVAFTGLSLTPDPLVHWREQVAVSVTDTLYVSSNHESRLCSYNGSDTHPRVDLSALSPRGQCRAVTALLESPFTTA